jgi:hypothetical protein
MTLSIYGFFVTLLMISVTFLICIPENRANDELRFQAEVVSWAQGIMLFLYILARD